MERKQRANVVEKFTEAENLIFLRNKIFIF